MKSLDDLQLDSELAARRIRRKDLRDGSGLRTGYPHKSARLQAGDLLELGVHSDLLRKSHLPIADHEQPAREQQEAAQHKHPDASHSRLCRH